MLHFDDKQPLKIPSCKLLQLFFRAIAKERATRPLLVARSVEKHNSSKCWRRYLCSSRHALGFPCARGLARFLARSGLWLMGLLHHRVNHRFFGVDKVLDAFVGEL